MITNRFSTKLLSACGFASLAFGLLFTAQSCSETINDGDFAIAKDQTITDYLASDMAQFSDIKYIFDRVQLGNKENASVLSSVLSARGNYTVFVPTNDALRQFVASIVGAGKSVRDLNDEQAQLVAYSCVIDNGSEQAYESAEFPTDGGAFTRTDLSDRAITCREVLDSTTNKTYYLINGQNKVKTTDLKKSNGYLHIVESVIAPSNAQVPDLIKGTENMRVMGALLDATGWSELLAGYHIDDAYEAEEHEQTWTLNQVSPFNVAQHRYLCFTGFVETDDVFAKYGVPAPQYDAATETITNSAAIVDAITSICEKAYGTEAKGDLKNPKNAVNRFVAYHFIKGKVAHNQFVQHFNEWGYKYGDMKNPQQKTYSIDIWDYFVTVGKHVSDSNDRDSRELIKVMQDAANKNIYLNRVCTYDTDDNYKQKSVVREGIQVLPTNEVNGKVYDNNAKNGYFFPITDLLIMDGATRQALGSERIRMDVTTMLPELLSYGSRNERKYTYFPKLISPRKDGSRGYFENILNESEDTRLLYLHSAHYGGTGWTDYEGDEFMVSGLYDFVLRLPPVPVKDTYEIRMGLQNNSLRGMCQIYFGTAENNLQPVGVPLDMRQSPSYFGWVGDVKDAAVNAENDKNFRNQGYMKHPRIFTTNNGTGENAARDYVNGMRRIIHTVEMQPGKTYYLRFKSALNKSDSQFFSDYFEFVPRGIYNGSVPEDQW